MKIKIASNAGFCFGVKRAMKMALNEIEKNNENIYALGPLIHNKQAVEKYEQKGLKTKDELVDIPSNANMIIRSHGVCEQIYNDARAKDINIIDTTCPFVKKIQDIAKEYYEKGYQIIVIGDMNHPEVIGINGWCNNEAVIVKRIDFIENLELDKSKKYCVVAQTTINTELYAKVEKILKDKVEHIIFNNTICAATKVRQEAARKLSRQVDCMIVIGGKHSSNTQKLVDICKDNVPTYAIETKEDLQKEDLAKYSFIGITAGASTPQWIIDDVEEFVKNLG